MAVNYGTLAEINANSGVTDATQPEIDAASRQIDQLPLLAWSSLGNRTVAAPYYKIDRADLTAYQLAGLFRAVGEQILANRYRIEAEERLSGAADTGSVRRIKGPEFEIEYSQSPSARGLRSVCRTARSELRAVGLLDTSARLVI